MTINSRARFKIESMLISSIEHTYQEIIDKIKEEMNIDINKDHIDYILFRIKQDKHLMGYQ